MSILLEAHKKALTHELINPESSPLMEVVDALSEADQKLVADEWLYLFDYCREHERRMDDAAFEGLEPTIVKVFTAKYGRA